MNSVLQSLYFINEFRKNVYNTMAVNKKTNLTTVALQHVFRDLQLSDKSVSTMKLIKNLGNTQHRLKQHDAHEFLRELLQTIREETSQNCVESSRLMLSLFEGKLSTLYKFKKVEYIKQFEEEFHDIQLIVSGKKNREYRRPTFKLNEKIVRGSQYYLFDYLHTSLLQFPNRSKITLPRQLWMDPIRSWQANMVCKPRKKL